MGITAHIKYPVKRGLYAIHRFANRRFHSANRAQIGWITPHTLEAAYRHQSTERLGHLGSVADMRISNNAQWINKHSKTLWNEIYDPRRKCDVAIFVKAMDGQCQREAAKIQAYGGKVIFDANVNYYEIWGTYDVPGTQPTPRQQSDAIQMTQMADWVIADSTYLENVIRPINARVTHVPDNVDMALFRGLRRHKNRSSTRLIWSGVGKKARHLLEIKNALGTLKHVELILISDEPPEVMAELKRHVPCRYIPYSNRRYAQALRNADIIISPKCLNNAYEMGHTEYKITLGMAIGLPAVASPQQSYREAIEHLGGGIIASSPDEWHDALHHLTQNAERRADLGARAQQTVRECYATPVVAKRYESVIRNLLGMSAK